MPQRLLQIIHSYIPSGLILWLLTWLIPIYSQIERIILFAAFVVVPLTVFRVLLSSGELSNHTMLIKRLINFHPIGVLTLSISFSLVPGFTTGLLSIPWTLVTLIIAFEGIRLLRTTPTIITVSKAFGFLYLSIGGIWLVAHQFSIPILGFHGEMMLLTVNHFHYAGLVAPVLFGYLYEHVKGGLLAKTGLILALIAPILIALGITYSPNIEWLSVIVFVASLLIYSTLVFIKIVPHVTAWTKYLHIASSGIIWVTMALAVIYGYGQWAGQSTIAISTMVLFHGWGNAVGFTFLGILAWHTTIMDQETARIPFSRIQGKGKIGSDIFNRLDAIEHVSSQRPTGLVDKFSDYKSKHLNPSKLHPDIIDFYENTEDYELLLAPHWSKAFAFPARFYKWMSNKMEQMNFPLQAETDEEHVESEILPIKDEKDSRNNVRAWVRTYTDTNKAIYAALYSTHVTNNTRYMNIAFPLPFAQMTSILILELGENDTLSLTSWASSPKQDQGVYLVFKQKAIRLPINETITVWKNPSSPIGKIEAKHDMWLFGVKFLTLDYSIRAT